MRGLRGTAAGLWLVLGAGGAFATAPDCEALAEAAAQRHGIPQGVLAAIARTESGGGPRRSAWPWTLNMGGDGQYLPTEAEALAALRQALEAGRRNVDVGCMQINWHWHNDAFDSLEQMIDPAANADYAARFLVSLWRREGTWDGAVQAYHSTDPDRGTAYLARVERNRAAGAGQGALVADAGAGGMLSEGVMPRAAAADGTARRGDDRFAGQAPLVLVRAEPVSAAPAPDALWAALPEGTAPNMAALSRSPGVARAIPAGAQDRLARLRADFSHNDAPMVAP